MNAYLYQADAKYGPFDTGCPFACWNFDFSIMSDCKAATSPTLPVGGLTCELCVDNDPTKAVRSICFDPFRSFFGTANSETPPQQLDLELRPKWLLAPSAIVSMVTSCSRKL
ncbi:unnamed protein product [Polarella glacialis]|uniref:Uncharacterized protein n=1 Tax=Polarella glacialis TaxID=89957 RepID=A0A813HUZ9_POLGL|nr:unnamed protein product [Polarella glacialis]